MTEEKKNQTPIEDSVVPESRSPETPTPPIREAGPQRHSSHKRVSRHHHRAPPNSGFEITERIGKGSFATVYKGEWGGDLKRRPVAGEPRQDVAIKVVQLSHIKRDKRLLANFEGEMAILKQMKHPHIVHLIEVVQTSSDFNLIMEYCSMGDLSAFIRKKQHLVKQNQDIADTFARYPCHQTGLHPTLVRHFLAQLASSLTFLRQHDLVHRDVKPQNLLLKPACASPIEARELGYVGKWDLPVLKIADFGFARFLPATSMAETLCGSPLYMAPEILNYEKYNAKADLWSVGAVTYEMVTGRPPFPASNHIELIKKIDKGKDQIVFPFDVADDLQNLIRGLLKRSPAERMSFDEFFSKTMWTEYDEAGSAASLTSETQIARGAPHSLDRSGSDRSTSSIHSDLVARKPTNRRISSEVRQTPGGFSSFSEYMRHRGADDVAVASPSPSPSPESSFNVKRSSSSGSRRRSPGSGLADDDDRTQRQLQPAPHKTGDSENEYVFIEKRMVEVNSLADDFQTPNPSSRRLTNPETKSRRRRLSSIAYGASPTNALAQALLKSSVRLFGAKADSAASSPANPLPVVFSPSQAGEKQVIENLEQLATIGKVVSLYADVKYTQLDHEDDESVGSHTASDIYPIHSPSQFDPYSQLVLASEALSLHLKALSVFSRAMASVSDWWNENGTEKVDKRRQRPSPGINTLVQWIRDKFNECVQRAEIERGIMLRFSQEANTPPPRVSAEKLLFDRALEMAKAAAVQEMAALDTTVANSETLSTSEMNYGTAVWMLRALVDSEEAEHALSEDDRTMVDTLMAKIAQRLAGLRRKSSSTTVSSASSQASLQRSAMDKSGHGHGSGSYVGAMRPSLSQLTPP